MSQQVTAEELGKPRRPKITWEDCNDVFFLYEGDLYIQLDDGIYDLDGNRNRDISLDDEIELVKEVKITYVKA